MKAMILAAGLGTRMRPLTDHTPKPLLAVGGKPLIVWHIERLRDAGFTDIVINTAWLAEVLEAAIGDGSQFGVSIRYSREGEPLETAGGIRRALPLLRESDNAPFLVVNGDIWTDIDFASLHLTSDFNAHLVLVDNPEHNPDGDFHLASDGKVRDNSAANIARLTFSGVGLYRPSLFDGLKNTEAKLAPLLRHVMALGAVSGVHHQGQWWDIGTPQRLQQLDDFLTN
ncbi:MAG: nucleotidyltransferase family protein [Alcanivoracaceae bacterium]|nr:nucleotidyltransferase family protein [Alcanivoracaceae bacterium]